MTTIPASELRDSPIRFVGAFDFDQRPLGISPRRLPAWTRPQVPELMNVMVRMPAGVRLAFRTNSTRISLQALTTLIVMPDREQRSVGYDLVIDGEAAYRGDENGNRIFVSPDDPSDFTLERGEAADITFDDLGSEEKDCELWLPHNAYVELRGLTIDQEATLLPPSRAAGPVWMHYGSSISHCAEASRPTGTWPAVAASLGGRELWSLGFGGQCHLDQFVARTLRDSAAEFISVKVGINIANRDSMRERVFTPALHGFLDTIREGKPTTPILVVSPIYCPFAEHVPGPHLVGPDGKLGSVAGHEELREGCLTLTRMRTLIEEAVAARRQAGDSHLQYLDGRKLFSAEDVDDLPDDLHPNSAGYRKMGERFADLVFTESGLLASIS